VTLHGETRDCHGHEISRRGIKVGKAMIEVMDKLPVPK